MIALGDSKVNFNLHRCEGCKNLLSEVDDDVIGLVLDQYGERIEFYHVSHAPEANRIEHERQEAML